MLSYLSHAPIMVACGAYMIYRIRPLAPGNSPYGLCRNKLKELLGLPKQQAKASRGEDPSLPLETGAGEELTFPGKGQVESQGPL